MTDGDVLDVIRSARREWSTGEVAYRLDADHAAVSQRLHDLADRKLIYRAEGCSSCTHDVWGLLRAGRVAS